MPLVVHSGSIDNASVHKEIEAPVPTRPNLFGPLVESGVSTVRAVPKLPVQQNKRLVPNLERPYHELDKGRIKLYRVQPRGKTMFYVVEVNGHEIGPLRLIQELKFDRNRYFIKAEPNTVEIPEALQDVVFIQSMVLVTERGFTDHCVFVSSGAELETIKRIMKNKYPRPTLELPDVDIQPYEAQYLVITGSE